MGHNDESIPFLHEEQPQASGVKKYGTGVLLLVSISGVLFAGSKYTSDNSTMSELSSIKDFTVALSNEYTAIHGHPAVDYTWVEEGKLVEPYKSTKFSVNVGKDMLDDLSTSCQAFHSHTDEVIDGVTVGSECALTFTRPGSYRVHMTLQHKTYGSIGELDTDVISRYVRRDIRKLNSDDLSAFMESMHTLYEVDIAQGAKKYGTDYKSISYFVDKHLKNSVPDKHHDYMHDGMGFLTQHISITNEFESALQVVNPAVCVPYWDFTQDFVMIKELAKANKRAVKYSDLWSLDMWTSDYFGSSVGSSLHTVTEGRWAYTRVPKATTKDSLDANVFGFLRAPWNVQSSPYVTRYHTMCGESIGGVDSYLKNQWPTCKEHYASVFDIDAYAEFVPAMAYIAHAGVHFMVGGSGGDCDSWLDDVEEFEGSKIKMIKSQSPFLLRNIWRYDLCTVPESTDCAGFVADASSETTTCKLSCSGCENDEFTDDQLADLTQWFSGDVTNDLTTKQLQSITKLVFCDSKILVGEHLEASSPVDASFWPMHPTLERLMQYKQLVKPFKDYTWDASTYRTDWTSECKWGLTFGVDCQGHAASDMTAGSVSYLDESTGLFVSKRMTNYDLVDVSKSDKTFLLPYVYDTFSYEHCNAEGILFPQVSSSSSDVPCVTRSGVGKQQLTWTYPSTAIQVHVGTSKQWRYS